MKQSNHCAACRAEFVPSGCTTGYGVDKAGNRICFACWGARDLADALSTGKWCAYLSTPAGETRRMISNWPGSLRVAPVKVKTSHHNIGRTRNDVWFRIPADPYWWHGVNIGDSDILRCKRTKERCHRV
jgi:hypothetical protein